MVTERNSRITSDLAIPPGELLEEELEAIGMSQQELAVRTGRPAQVINEIVRGKKAITHDTALELEKVLGIPAHIWINLEAEYQLTKARQRDHLELEKQQDWLGQFPVRELKKRTWLPKTTDTTDTVNALLQFLGVASFSAWRQTPEAIAFRITPGSKVSEGALACWLRKGELEGQALETATYDEGKFRSALLKIRALTRESPQAFEPQMTDYCAEAGVAFVVIPELPKSGANGATRWIGPQKALIQLSLRYGWSDHFWFSFFHESCHTLLHKLKDIHVDGIDGDLAHETEANEFAANSLIELGQWRSFIQHGDFGRLRILAFAEACEIAPGVIVGRLQHEGLIPFNALNALRTRFEWVES